MKKTLLLATAAAFVMSGVSVVKADEVKQPAATKATTAVRAPAAKTSNPAEVAKAGAKKDTTAPAATTTTGTDQKAAKADAKAAPKTAKKGGKKKKKKKNANTTK